MQISRIINKEWYLLLKQEFSKEYFKKLNNFLKEEYTHYEIYPSEKQIFEAFNLTPFANIKVLLLGQDPYHNENQANGLSFSVNNGVKLPPSLKNIYKELHSDLGIEPASHGDLTQWAKQGVLLLNATLTVRKHAAGSHQRQGWEEFTDAVIQLISDKLDFVIFILWGNFARSKVNLINRNKHFILEAAHPSPFSAHNGFFGCKHFSRANQILAQKNKLQIDWSLHNL